jgi:hypothetical protein
VLGFIIPHNAGGRWPAMMTMGRTCMGDQCIIIVRMRMCACSMPGGLWCDAFGIPPGISRLIWTACRLYPPRTRGLHSAEELNERVLRRVRHRRISVDNGHQIEVEVSIGETQHLAASP